MIKIIIMVVMMLSSNFTIAGDHLWHDIGTGDFFVWHLNDEHMVIEKGRDFLPNKNQDYIGEVTYSFGSGRESFRQLILDDQNVLLPAYGGTSYNYTFADGGQIVYVGDNYGLYELKASTGEKRDLISITEEEFYTYSHKSLELHNENWFYYCAGLTSNPSGNYLAYISNKNHLEDLINALYIYNLETAEETLLQVPEAYDDYFMGWLDDQRLVSTRRNDDTTQLSVLDLQGNEKIIPLKGDNSFIYEMNSDYIIYAETLGSPKIHVISSYNLEEILVLDAPGEIIYRGHGNYRDDQWGYLYSTDSGYTRYIQIVDLKTGEVQNLEVLPDSEESILTFWWIGENRLLLVTLSNLNGIPVEKGWIVQLTNRVK